MALISLAFKKIYKPTNNNLRTSSNTSRANQDNSLRINRGTRYNNQWICDVAKARETVEQADWKDDTDDEPKDQELKAHYMYMAQIQEVSLDAADNSRPIFDFEPLQKVSNDDNYNVFAIESEHPEQYKSVHETYLIEQDEHNVIIDSLDMSYDREQIDQDDDDDDDLANELDKLKGEIEDFKTKNKSLESSNNRFKEANNKLSETNELMYNELKKFQAELDRRNDVKYASKMEIDCAKAKGDLMSYKMESEKSFNAYTQKINDLNQTISEMKKELFAHQETISILLQAKEAQIKLYKTREDKELDKAIALENKFKVLDSIVYKTAPESDEVIHLEKESRSKLSVLIKPFDYEKLNNLCALFISQHEKSINADLEKFHLFLKEEMVADLRYFNSLELEVDSLKSQLETQKTQFLNEIDQLSREYYYADHMNAILGMYTELDELTNLQCDYLEMLDKANQSKEFCKEREQYFEVQDLKAQLQDKGIATSELKKLIERLKGKYMDTKFDKSLVIRQPNAFKSQRPSILGLNHNLFPIGQFYDADLEVAFRKSMCYIRDLKRNDLLTCSLGTDLYSISLQDTSSPNPIYLMAKATSSQAWLWHHRLSHLNFDTINLLSNNDIVIGLPKLKFVKDHLFSSCELGKAKQKSFQTKTIQSSKRRLQLLHMGLYGPMRVDSINGKKYLLVIVNDYSRYTWTHFLRSKDETPKVLIDFLRLVQRGLHAQVRTV
nr:retrovirus-related Pol polyprotein from transposon TNT 1-94 [Tanacetum cinerariifolium]